MGLRHPEMVSRRVPTSRGDPAIRLLFSLSRLHFGFGRCIPTTVANQSRQVRGAPIPPTLTQQFFAASFVIPNCLQFPFLFFRWEGEGFPSIPSQEFSVNQRNVSSQLYGKLKMGDESSFHLPVLLSLLSFLENARSCRLYPDTTKGFFLFPLFFSSKKRN